MTTRSLAEAPAPRLRDARLQGFLGFHLRMADAAVQRDFNTATAPGFSQKQFAVLSLIEENPRVSQVDIGAHLDTDRATMVTIVERLVQRGLIVRTASAQDRRRVELVLSDEGRGQLHSAATAVARHEAALFSGLSPLERRMLIDILDRIHAVAAGKDRDGQSGNPT